MGYLWPLALLLCSIFILASCSPNADQVTLGAIYNLTNDQSGLDDDAAKGVRLAINEINAAGGIFGKPVNLELKDGETNISNIASHTRWLIDNHPTMPVIIGMSDTDMVMAAAPIAAENNYPFITSGATSPKLSGEVPDYLFLACFGDNVQAAAGAEWAFNILSAKTVSVIYDESESYTRLLHAYFQTRFVQLGGKIISVKKYRKDNFNQAIKELQPADFIYVAAGPAEVLAIVKALRRAGFEQPVLGGDGFDVENLWQQHPDVENLHFTTHAYLGHDNPDPAVQAFIKAFYNAYPDSMPNAFSALGYDTVKLAFTAIKNADSTEPEDVRDALAKMHNFKGVTGNINFHSDGPIPSKPVAIISVSKGQLEWQGNMSPAVVPSP